MYIQPLAYLLSPLLIHEDPRPGTYKNSPSIQGSELISHLLISPSGVRVQINSCIGLVNAIRNNASEDHCYAEAHVLPEGNNVDS